jgi:acylglycerol lipase
MDTATNFTEGTLKTPDGVELYTKTWNTSGPAKARLVFIHGFSDHCNFYGDLFRSLSDQGITVYSFDQRGWGRSVHQPSQRGQTGPTSQVLDDISHFIRNLPASTLPLFLMGHSMGGAETLVYAAQGPSDITHKIRGYLVESPFIALHPAARPWRVTVTLGRLASKVLPNMPMLNKLDASKICRDPEVCRVWQEDALCHDTGTLAGLAGMLDRAGDLEGGKVVVGEGLGEGGRTRLWVGHGTGDEVCGFDACEKFFKGLKVEDKEFRRYDGWYHKLHSEPGQDSATFAREVAKWVLDRSGDLTTIGKPKL